MVFDPIVLHVHGHCHHADVTLELGVLAFALTFPLASVQCDELFVYSQKRFGRHYETMRCHRHKKQGRRPDVLTY